MSTIKFAHTLSVYRAVAKNLCTCTILQNFADYCTFYLLLRAICEFALLCAFLTNFVHFALVACVNAYMHISVEEIYKKI